MMTKLRKNIFIILSILLLSLMIAETVIFGNIQRVDAKQNSEDKISYVLAEYDNKIAIFKNGSDTPICVYDVYVFSLPEDERIKLSEGINIYSDEQLISLIEAYTS